jgi:foldase protein PrsA
MKARFGYAVLLAALVSGWAAQAEDAAVAVVNGTPITEKAFTDRLKAQYGYSTLEQMIEEVALQQAADKGGAKVADDAIAKRIADMQAGIEARSSVTGLNFASWLAGQNLTLASLKTQVRLEMLMEALVKDKVKVTQAQVSDFYAKSRDQFHEPEQVKVSHICVKTKDEAEKIRADILGGKKSFADAARDFSIDPYSKNTGGDLGFVVAGDDPLQVAAFALQKDGELSPVIQSKMGFHVLKRDARKTERIVPFEEVEARLRTYMERQETSKLASQKRDEIIKAAQIDRKVKLDAGQPAPGPAAGPAPQ